MGTITISVDDDTERTFREVAGRKLGKKKGYLGQATTEAMRLWIRQMTQEEIARDALHLLETSVDYGEWRYRGRQELYDRDNKS
jgi:hypothetical protein